MTAFAEALVVVLRLEGAASNDPSDAGGQTCYGISQRAYPDEDIQHITRARAAELYLRDYWTPLSCDSFSAPVALALFDCGVSQGPQVAASLLQQAVGATIDGKVGHDTILAARNLGAEVVVPRLLRLRALRYMQLARSKPSQQCYLDGWIQRCFEIAQVAANSIAGSTKAPMANK